MHLVRPATRKDLEGFYSLAMKSSLGLTNLPKDREFLSTMLERSERAFHADVQEPGKELYIFCLERVADQKLLGTAMIQAKFPYHIPLPYFIRYPENGHDELHLTFETEGISELCGLFLDSEARKGGLGRLLSISRLLFIADHLQRFNTKVFAEIRGVVKEDGTCPFWEGLMRSFFNISFAEGIDLYIKDLEAFNKKLPKDPIYYDLLSDETKKCIGVIHPKSVPAYNLLEKEGFEMTKLIHPLDGGPRVEGFIKSLHAIQESDVLKIRSFHKNDHPLYLIAAAGKPFRCAIGHLAIEEEEAVIDHQTANLLQLGVGDLCRILPLH